MKSSDDGESAASLIQLSSKQQPAFHQYYFTHDERIRSSRLVLLFSLRRKRSWCATALSLAVFITFTNRCTHNDGLLLHIQMILNIRGCIYYLWFSPTFYLKLWTFLCSFVTVSILVYFLSCHYGILQCQKQRKLFAENEGNLYLNHEVSKCVQNYTHTR